MLQLRRLVLGYIPHMCWPYIAVLGYDPPQKYWLLMGIFRCGDLSCWLLSW